jgi:soluble lytic murein transglycosylase
MRDHKKVTALKLSYICIGIFMTVLFNPVWIKSVHADIYVYIDNQGVLHFTNVPTSPVYKFYMRERPSKSLGADATDKYDLFITKASQRHGLSFPLLKAIIKVESDFNPRAVSKKGAMGLMQIMPENIKRLKVKDPFDPWENIMAGARYFKLLLDRFNGKVPLTLAAYNAGPDAVAQYQRIPPYKETEAYVRKVMKYFYAFKQS